MFSTKIFIIKQGPLPEKDEEQGHFFFRSNLAHLLPVDFISWQ